MAQIDRIRTDLATIAVEEQGPEAARQAAQQRINRFIRDAAAFYAGEPDATARLLGDLAALSEALSADAASIQPGPLARAYGHALGEIAAKLRAARNGGSD